MKNELKPCPFCGNGTLVIVTELSGGFIGPQCQRCGASIRNVDREKAIEFWNARTETDEILSLRKERAEAKDYLSQCLLFLERSEEFPSEKFKEIQNFWEKLYDEVEDEKKNLL